MIAILATIDQINLFWIMRPYRPVLSKFHGASVAAFRRAVVWAIALIPGACGFHPMLAANDGRHSVAGQLSTIHVASIEGRSGQVLRNDLVEALNPQGEPTSADYTLNIRIEEPQQNLAFQRNNSVTDVGLTVIAYLTLRDNKSGAIVYSAQTSSHQLYSVSNSQYATGVSATSTRDHIMATISGNIRNRLAQFLISQAPSQTAPAH